MGQYYKPVILKKDFRTSFRDKKAEVALESWDYNEGAKLMEHSYIGNYFVNVAVNLLAGKFYGYPFVWCGDYADDIRKMLDEIPDAENGEEESIEKDEIIPYNFEGQYKPTEEEEKTMNRCKYILNLTKKQYVDLTKVEEDADGYKIHPLPLLTCSGCGRGGGDFWGTPEELVGTWAYDEIGVGDEVPDDFTELIPNFKENR